MSNNSEVIFVRHGKPNVFTKQWLSAKAFTRWIDSYDAARLELSSFPPEYLVLLSKNAFVITSTLPRAMDSAKKISSLPIQSCALLNEMHLPSFQIPWIKLPISCWLLINRILWLAGFSSEVESFKNAKGRALLMADRIASTAQQNKRVIIVGHGLMNRAIAKQLLKNGWTAKYQGSGYWSSITLLK